MEWARPIGTIIVIMFLVVMVKWCNNPKNGLQGVVNDIWYGEKNDS